MAEQDKLVEVTLSRPFTTNGVVHGYETQDVVDEKTGKTRKAQVFTGKAKVSPELAEDLERREAEYQAYLVDLNRDKGGQVPVVV
jgi:hypothetical protein